MQIKQDTIYLNYKLRPSLVHIYKDKLQYTPMHLLEKDLRYNTFQVFKDGKVSIDKYPDNNHLIQECISLKEVAYERNKDAISDLFEIVYRNDDKRIDAAKVLVNVIENGSLNIQQISTQQNTFKIYTIDNYRTFVALSSELIIQDILNKHVKLRDRLWFFQKNINNI